MPRSEWKCKFCSSFDSTLGKFIFPFVFRVHIWILNSKGKFLGNAMWKFSELEGVKLNLKFLREFSKSTSNSANAKLLLDNFSKIYIYIPVRIFCHSFNKTGARKEHGRAWHIILLRNIFRKYFKCFCGTEWHFPKRAITINFLVIYFTNKQILIFVRNCETSRGERGGHLQNKFKFLKISFLRILEFKIYFQNLLFPPLARPFSYHSQSLAVEVNKISIKILLSISENNFSFPSEIEIYAE